jgi:hypothetical protein
VAFLLAESLLLPAQPLDVRREPDNDSQTTRPQVRKVLGGVEENLYG